MVKNILKKLSHKNTSKVRRKLFERLKETQKQNRVKIRKMKRLSERAKSKTIPSCMVELPLISKNSFCLNK